MGNYVEKYELPGKTLGIEDHEAPGEHFFQHDYKSGVSKRFQCWSNGCGIGLATSIEEARQILFKYVIERLDEECREHTKQMNIRKRALQRLRGDVFNLGMFRKHG